MSTSWIHKTDANTRAVDDRGGALQYVFTYTVGALFTSVQLSTTKYEWDERPDEASSVVLEPFMPIQQQEAFLASENADWVQMCEYWAANN